MRVAWSGSHSGHRVRPSREDLLLEELKESKMAGWGAALTGLHSLKDSATTGGGGQAPQSDTCRIRMFKISLFSNLVTLMDRLNWCLLCSCVKDLLSTKAPSQDPLSLLITEPCCLKHIYIAN